MQRHFIGKLLTEMMKGNYRGRNVRKKLGKEVRDGKKKAFR